MLASISCWIVTPNFSAITPSVSPASTTYFCPLAGAADDGAADDGAAAADADAEGAVLGGAAEAEALALGRADALALGVAARCTVGEAAPFVGVGVAVSREQAPKSSAPPSRLAIRPSRKR